MSTEHDTEEPTLPDWATDYSEPFDVACIELMREMGLDGAADFNEECHRGMGGMGPAAVASDQNWSTDLTPENVREKTATLVRDYVIQYHQGVAPEDDPIHDVIAKAELLVDEDDEDDLEPIEELWETPRVVSGVGNDRFTIGLLDSPGRVEIFQSANREKSEWGDYLWNAWDGELYRVSSIRDDVVTLDVLNAEKSIQVSRDFIEIDGDRIIPMEEL